MSLTRYPSPNPVSVEKTSGTEALRINVDTEVLELRARTENIHVSFLFTQNARDIFRTICGGVGSSALNGFLCPNWRDLADYLRLTTVQIRNIENYFQQYEGPVYWVLASYSQWIDATIWKVINALKEMEREDIIREISQGVRQLVDFIHKQMNLDANESRIIVAECIPPVPLILEPPSSERNRIHQVMKFASGNSRAVGPSNNDNSLQISMRMAFRVMLTFADDGKVAAKRIAQFLRSCNPRIGVLILEEQMSHLLREGDTFVDDCFKQVDYIFPILTQGYDDSISNRPLANRAPPGFGTDGDYVKYIFDSLREESRYNHWRNKRVVAIIPRDLGQRPPRPHKILAVTFGEEKIEELVRNLSHSL